VSPGHGAVFQRAADGDLELARQEGEFRMEGRPLAQHFAVRARIDDFVGATPANGSVVMLRMQLPEVWMACISTVASSARMSAVSSSFGQLNCMFCRVVKWP
jgi:hypothetical protein